MYFPRLKIDLSKIHSNARIINDRCAKSGISVVGVTKAVLAEEIIVRTLSQAGIKIFADSRLPNLKKLYRIIDEPENLIMLRSPMPDEIEELVNICGTSLNTQMETVRLLSDACIKYDLHHNIVVMVEIDDEREGLLPSQVYDFCRKILETSKFIHISGIGTNARCIKPNGPTRQSIDILISLKKDLEKTLGIEIGIVSGGNSSIWNMLETGKLPPEVNQVRIGEAIFQGHETAECKNINGTFQDCFMLEARIIEIKREKGIPYRLILALGIQDVEMKNLDIIESGLCIRSQSSDHTMLDIKSGNEKASIEKGFSNFEVGGIISFNLNYFGLLSCMSSPFIEKEFILPQDS